MRGSVDTYTSNLINDEEMAARFSEEAYKVALSLRPKYYTLFEFMSADDIVMECWDKILRQDIGFDTTRRCKFSSFVRMMVNNRCIDLCRKIQKHEGIVSLDQPLSASDNGDAATLADFIPSAGNSEIAEVLEVRDIILSLNEDLTELPIAEISELLEEGYSSPEISDKLNISLQDVRSVKSKISRTFMRRYSGTGRTLADVLYGDEEELMRCKDELMGTLYYIKEDGIRLSDIVELVIKNHSYKSIGKRLHISTDRVHRFLDRYAGLEV